MKKVFNALALSLVAVLFSIRAHAGGGGSEAGNGGNAAALEFLDSAQRVLQTYHSRLKTYPELKKLNLKQTLDKAQVLVSSIPIYVTENGTKQECSAMNFPEQLTIVISEKRWARIMRPAIREALALHELLGLLKIEGTGNYNISKRYLNENGISCPSGLCEDNGQAKPKSDQTYCRFDNKWYPSFATFKYRFQCAAEKSDFAVWCDLFQDPVEFGTNKIDVLGGIWKGKDKTGGFLQYSDIDSGLIYCTYRDE